MADYGIIAIFGLLLLVVIGSAVVFRRRAMGTPLRVVLSVAAVLLLGGRLLRDNGLNAGTVVLTLLAAVILGSGILFLRRVERQGPPTE